MFAGVGSESNCTERRRFGSQTGTNTEFYQLQLVLSTLIKSHITTIMSVPSDWDRVKREQ